MKARSEEAHPPFRMMVPNLLLSNVVGKLVAELSEFNRFSYASYGEQWL